MNLFNNIDLSEPSDFGLIYQGSKRKINYELFKVIENHAPYANYFYDLSGGGGGMSFNALKYGYKVHYNELNEATYLLIEYLLQRVKLNKKGKYGILDDICYKFVTRDDFKRILTKEHKSGIDYLLLNIYSFACDGRNYYCKSEKEINKYYGHYLILDNKEESANYYSIVFYPFKHIIQELHHDIFPKLEWQERQAIWVNICLKMESLVITKTYENLPKMDFHAFHKFKQREVVNHINTHCQDLQVKTHYKSYKGQTTIDRLKEIQQLQQLQRLEQLEQLQQLQRLERLEQLQDIPTFQTLQTTKLSYNQIEITTPPDETIIYLDPPYKDTDTEAYHKELFDYDAYYEYAINKAKQGFNVFCSEYNMPADRFECIFEKEVRNNKCHNLDNRIEKLYKPKI